MEAYQHGIAITCIDGVVRCFYPRIFVYIADYPEKLVLYLTTNLPYVASNLFLGLWLPALEI